MTTGRVTDSPTSWATLSISMTSPTATFCCWPPLRTIAYTADSLSSSDYEFGSARPAHAHRSRTTGRAGSGADTHGRRSEHRGSSLRTAAAAGQNDAGPTSRRPAHRLRDPFFLTGTCSTAASPRRPPSEAVGAVAGPSAGVEPVGRRAALRPAPSARGGRAVVPAGGLARDAGRPGGREQATLGATGGRGPRRPARGSAAGSGVGRALDERLGQPGPTSARRRHRLGPRSPACRAGAASAAGLPRRRPRRAPGSEPAVARPTGASAGASVGELVGSTAGSATRLVGRPRLVPGHRGDVLGRRRTAWASPPRRPAAAAAGVARRPSLPRSLVADRGGRGDRARRLVVLVPASGSTGLVRG